MTAETKVISVINKLAKNGNKYREVWIEVTIEDQVFIKKLVLF